ncbi:MAG TPA: NAD(P)/FAD-dependent oxidoreductase, partial [Polyangiales bacterium]
MSTGTPYKHAQLADRYDSVVIGSGIGGLATASLLARHAHERVLVLERHYVAGGFTHAFKRPGFDWDVGVHYIGEVHRRRSSLRRIFDHLSDGALDWADMGEVYDRIRLGERSFDYVAGHEALRQRLVAEFSHERAGIERYLALVRSIARSSQLYFAEKLLPARLASLLGPAMRYPTLRHARRTTAQVVHELVRDPELRGVLTAQWGDYGLPPAQSSFLVHAMVAGHYLEGAAYPHGGSTRIAQTIIPGIERAGGAVIVRAEVTRVLLEAGRAIGVELGDGRRILSKRVVSDAGVAITFGQLLPEAARPVRVDAQGVGGLPASIGHLSLYVGLGADSRALALPKHNIWVYPSADHDGNYARAVR